ncbi:hypothetical protein FA15DRAFT_606569, partial [Coprinopsis marcescibilis]
MVEDTQEDLQQDGPLGPVAVGVDHLVPLSGEEKHAIIREWQETMSPYNFTRQACAVCAGIRFKSDILVVSSHAVDLTLLVNPLLPVHVRPQSYALEEYEGAILCPSGLLDLRKKGDMFICRSCFGDMKESKMPRLALANWLYYGRERLPIGIANDFKQSSVFEKALICRVRKNGICCRFTDTQTTACSGSFFLGSRKVKGNVLLTPLDAPMLNRVLPPTYDTIADTICAIFVSRQPPTRETIKQFRPLLVRKSRVSRLIQFLVVNNPHYGYVDGFGGYSGDNLNALFDGQVGVPSAVHVGHLPSNDAISVATSGYQQDGDVGDLLMENVGFTMGDNTATSYREMTMLALERCLMGKPFIESRAGTEPVPDLKNPYLISWVFPHLDPWGIGGFYHPRRKRVISMEEQLAHLLQTDDSMFENDGEFAFVISNIIRKKRVYTGLRFKVPLSRYATIVDDIFRIDRAVLQDMIHKYRADSAYQPCNDQERFITRVVGSVTPVARNVPGSVAAKIQMRNEIRGLIFKRGSPTLFVTINPSDVHNPLVRVLACRCKSMREVEEVMDMGSTQRVLLASRSPVACALSFDYLIRGFISILLRAGGPKPSRGIYG